ncbi:uncharacterized protein PV07_12326 [Cladophialophora immunda]|uniref:Heterokaryon incompatibility domain-containing protein n=1 Tax=Cladophialophora immunda TaxID=569365 RepID=A0A0D1Z497_9EURO|nr:uncharacterized protein PV07_12326 [Cladophialophora immunda]KIW22441.1 hypothetical protein PV07_12326 [Cladophialophora immunda]
MASTEHKEAPLQSFVYDALPQADCDIRLLDLEWCEVKKILRGSLNAVGLAMDVGYETLSYTWNGETPSVPIMCNGKTLLITQSLNLALETLCKLSSPRRLWVDAICINQADDHEKAQQIPLMHLIYFSSNQVIVWLGTSTEATDRAMDMAMTLLEGLKTIREPNLEDYAPILEKLGLPIQGDLIWEGLGDLVSRRWHARLWTLQEFVSARKATVYCGSKSVDAEILKSLFSELGRTGLNFEILAKEDTRASGYTSFERFDYSILVFATYMARRRECSEPVDKIYAIRALCNPLESVRVDYTKASRKQYWKLYIEVGHLLLQEEPSLLALGSICTSSRCPELPSWCTDFNSVPLRHPIWDGLGAGGPAFEESVPPHVASSWDKRRIYLRGFAVDSFVQISDPFPDLELETQWSKRWFAHILEWLQHCLDSFAPYTKQDGDRSNDPSEAFLRGIFCAETDMSRSDLLELTQQYRLAILALEFGIHDRFLGKGGLESLLDINHAMTTINHIRTACPHRLFGVTAQGRLGLAPKELRDKDLLCVFRGAAVPFVLRPLDDSDTYELIGEAYVHGFMHGELFQDGRFQDDAGSTVFEVV